MGEIRGRLRILLLLVGLVSLLVPVAAFAGTKSVTTAVAGNAIVTLDATCPEGQRATGGGFIVPPLVGASFLTVHESRKIGQRTWRVSAENGNSNPSQLTTRAYCRKNAPRTASQNSGQSVSAASAGCANSGFARAGGFLAPRAGISGFFIAESFRLNQEAWFSRELFFSATNLRSYAYCAEGKKVKARAGSGSTNVDNGVVTVLSAPCKHGTKPGAGGFGQDANPFDGYFIHESFRVGKAWQVSGLRFNPGPATLQSVAYCS
jgi:hypothetical protein